MIQGSRYGVALDAVPSQFCAGELEATIVEVTLTDDLRFGVQWDAVEDQLRATFTDAAGGGVSSRFPGVSVSYVDTNIQAVINELVNIHTKQLQFVFQRMNTIATTIWRINHGVHM